MENFIQNTTDFTEQKNLEERLVQVCQELRQTQEMVMRQERLRILGQMASGIAHDISNSLMPILTNLDFLLDDDALSPILKDRYEAMHIAAQDIVSTINQLRGFYRLPQEEKPGLIDLNRMVEQAVNLTRFRWKDKAQQQGRIIEIKLDLQPALPRVAALESEIRGVLVNLLLNSIDAIIDNGCIIIRSRFQGSHIVLEVEDTGQGMEEATLQRCTEHFFTTKGLEGSGLGLAMVKDTIRRCHGKVEMKSTVGEGTTVRLSFLCPEDMKPASTAPEELPATPPHLHILHVEDDPDMQTNIRQELEQDGHKVVVADNGPQALDKFFSGGNKDLSFDLVIADLQKPPVTSHELLLQITKKLPDIPVFFLNKSFRLENLRGLIRKAIF